MNTVRYPSLYQINTRVCLTDLSRSIGMYATLDDISDAELDALAQNGFDWIWFLSVWQTGPAAQQVSRSNPEWRKEFHDTLPDLRDDDIPGSGFTITGYTAHADDGGDSALARLGDRLKKRGLKLVLDFVPNHMGLGHPWVETHPEHFIRGNDGERRRQAARSFLPESAWNSPASSLQVPLRAPPRGARPPASAQTAARSTAVTFSPHHLSIMRGAPTTSVR
jgi:hypothetical protein